MSISVMHYQLWTEGGGIRRDRERRETHSFPPSSLLPFVFHLVDSLRENRRGTETGEREEEWRKELRRYNNITVLLLFPTLLFSILPNSLLKDQRSLTNRCDPCTENSAAIWDRILEPATVPERRHLINVIITCPYCVVKAYVVNPISH